jgi:nicotinate-nucleotide pyrophosphorylase (carboxylating)
VRLATLSGVKRDLLTVERTLLNLISRMSGVATLTRAYVDKIIETRAVVCETRKTTPGLRSMEKYAARCGGAHLHRLGLHDAILIKDNHLEGVAPADLPAFLTDAISKARAACSLRFVEIEVDTIDQLEHLLRIPGGVIDIILLDNMPPDELQQAVTLRNAAKSAILLEASGGITFDTIRSVAETGVDRISIGALTHSAVSLDFGLDAG